VQCRSRELLFIVDALREEDGQTTLAFHRDSLNVDLNRMTTFIRRLGMRQLDHIRFLLIERIEGLSILNRENWGTLYS